MIGKQNGQSEKSLWTPLKLLKKFSVGAKNLGMGG